jgi:hypothetical protein
MPLASFLRALPYACVTLLVALQNTVPYWGLSALESATLYVSLLCDLAVRIAVALVMLQFVGPLPYVGATSLHQSSDVSNNTWYRPGIIVIVYCTSLALTSLVRHAASTWDSICRCRCRRCLRCGRGYSWRHYLYSTRINSARCHTLACLNLGASHICRCETEYPLALSLLETKVCWLGDVDA